MMVTVPPSIHDPVALEDFRRRWRIDPQRLRRFRYQFYRQFLEPEEALRSLGERECRAAIEEFNLRSLEEEERFDSATDGAAKLVMRAGDGARVETVRMQAKSTRTTVCVSTQVGCRAACPFCATARMGLHRDLTSEEIIDQILHVGRLSRREERRVKNVVFMGMGEPLHNEANLHAALAVLLSDQGCYFPKRRLSVSTVGVPAAMLRLADRFPGLPIALSLHSARPELRVKLVPWSRTHSWDELRNTLHDLATRPTVHRKCPIMIEHLMIDGVNDQDVDADALIEYLGKIPCIVNLIPYNSHDFVQTWRASPRERRGAFANRLFQAGIFTTIRYSMGSDVNAACGQLVQRKQAIFPVSVPYSG
jgi:23S rRNA (adenine2503-C2)-methyltransferase